MDKIKKIFLAGHNGLVGSAVFNQLRKMVIKFNYQKSKRVRFT